MNTRERFGNYILLKKLAEDPLGEVFRAGRLGNGSIEQVVLLRVFNGQGLDSAQLWSRVSQRGEVQGLIQSPNLGQGVDFGELQGIPYVVYDYISGKDLASLIAQARKEHSPVPADHALLITERIALGLAAAYENRLQGSRILHGFVVPGLVMVSNEGEARLLGFEVGSGLRDLARESPALRAYERYLAPETLAGQPAHKSDDVYSLGAILFELLTGEEMPIVQPGAIDALVDNAELANEGTALPTAISGLLKRSLAGRDQRIPDCVSWHKTLSQLMIDSQYNPTTFNLAFFMHNLFRDEIERESREIQVEKNIDSAGVEAPGGAPVPPADAAGAETMMVSSKEVEASPPPRKEAGEKKGKGGLIAAAVLLLALAGGGAWWWMTQQQQAPEPPPPVAAQPEPVPEPVPTGPTQEEIQAELERMRAEMADAMAAQSEEMRQTLAEQYEGRIADLQQQYEESQQAIQERRKKEQEEALAAQQAAIEEEARRRAQLQEEEAKRKAAAQQETRTAEKAADSGQPAQTASKPAAAPEPKEQAPPPPPPPPPAVRTGDLVQAGPGVTAPALLKQAPARYPPAARRLRREATVIVRVLVDENGKVVQAERLGKKAGLGIDEAAVEAAEASTFRPATKDGVRVKMWHSLRFDFRP